MAGVPAYAMRKMTWGPASEVAGTEQILYPRALKEGGEASGTTDSRDSSDARELRTISEVPLSRIDSPLDFDTATMVDTRGLPAPALRRIKDLSHSRCNTKAGSAGTFISSAATLVSSSSISSSENFSISLPDSSPTRSLSYSSDENSSSLPIATIEYVVQTLDQVDLKGQVLPEDPDAVAALIKFHNYDTAFKLGQHRHLHYYELPFPWRENRFIIHGYRFYNSYKKSLLSIFNWYGWHNETVNIWTHLGGALYLAYLLFRGFSQTAVYQSELVPTAAKCMAFVFLLSGLECFLFSVVWHTFNGICHLQQRSNCACVDYTGITILVTASILTTEFVTLSGAAEAPFTWSLLFFTTTSSILGVIGVYMNWSPKFDRPESRPLRIAFYLLLASFGFFSYLHSRIFHTSISSSELIKPVLSKSLAWYLIGVVFYGTFIPERWRSDVQVDPTIPTEHELITNLDIITKQRHVHFRSQPVTHQKCKNSKSKRSFSSLWWVDYFCCSHTLWHLFVLLGVVGHYKAMLEMFEKRWLTS